MRVFVFLLLLVVAHQIGTLHSDKIALRSACGIDQYGLKVGWYRSEIK